MPDKLLRDPGIFDKASERHTLLKAKREILATGRIMA